jgi:predicted aldo/keto reductase-like oxidoreductase
MKSLAMRADSGRLTREDIKFSAPRQPGSSNWQLGESMDRREFVKLGLTTALASGVSQSLLGDNTGGMQYRTLGRSGEKVSIVGLGGYHIGVQKDPKESLRIIRAALDSGLNFLDNCWDYNDGESEIRMGQALQDGYRHKAFLMTKIDGRDKNTAARQIEQSLQRLRTDHIDLLQFHEIIRLSDPEKIFAPGGGMEAALAARKAGKIRYLGFTGHKNPDVHLKMLHTAFARNFTFDAVQMPLNVMDAHFESFQKKVLPVLLEHRIGVLGMKSMGDSNILASKTVTPVECLHYAMNLPTSVVITGCDSMPILQQALKAAREFRPLSRQQVANLLARTAQVAANGRYEPYKTTHDFDGTYQNPEWLGPGQKAATYPQA